MNYQVARVLSVFLLAATLVACAGSNSQIGTSVTLCCPGNYEQYATYHPETRDIPLFLRDYVLAEFDDAIQEKGLYKGGDNSDLEILISYKHVSLDAEQQSIDPFIRMESLNVELRYLAVLEISMFERGTSNQVWGGQISRFHYVSPGEYMHEEDARPSFRQAFVEVLETYPDQTAD